jgi:hypothetical protein
MDQPAKAKPLPEAINPDRSQKFISPGGQTQSKRAANQQPANDLM